ncbi:MAG TPA: peptidylprolyl isomerase [Arenimonas sp.]|nr:peptidylprolyl isomerase [Arenimonas sp.]HOZ06154.1 peptidylprolyl isomerase [Arenimonas sp.]HPO25675.1 peptidylprolyl isomerase [Arenimonas sp.]
MFARICFFCLALLATPVFSQSLALPSGNNPKNPRVVIDTNHGKIVLELFADKAPATVGNFLSYVQSGHYDNTIIHRVAKDFLIQGGAYNINLGKKPQHNAIPLEKTTGLKNLRGTISAARKLSDANSATSEFFINLVDNPQLDFQSANSPLNQGFVVFGQIVDGIAVIDKIRKVATTGKNGFPELPVSPVVIRSISRVSE